MLESNNPYNTRRFQGLPPGPISNPGESALQAAANPVAGPWLYFVTVNLDTGETKFAATYEEHQRNVAQYRKQAAALRHIEPADPGTSRQRTHTSKAKRRQH